MYVFSRRIRERPEASLVVSIQVRLLQGSPVSTCYSSNARLTACGIIRVVEQSHYRESMTTFVLQVWAPGDGVWRT